MFNPAVDDDGSFDITFDGLNAGFNLGDHAAGYGSVLDQPFGLLGRNVSDQLTGAVHNAGDIGQHQQTLCADRTGDSAGHGVCVDVERLSVRSGADGGDDRGDVRFIEERQDMGVYFLRFADQA